MLQMTNTMDVDGHGQLLDWGLMNAMSLTSKT